MHILHNSLQPLAIPNQQTTLITLRKKPQTVTTTKQYKRYLLNINQGYSYRILTQLKKRLNETKKYNCALLQKEIVRI